MPGNLLGWILLGLLIAFFTFGGAANLLGPQSVIDDFRRWGYPRWFNSVTGIVELVTAILLVIPITRSVGAILGLGTMLIAVATVARHREYTHTVPALIVIGLLVVELSL